MKKSGSTRQRYCDNLPRLIFLLYVKHCLNGDLLMCGLSPEVQENLLLRLLLHPLVLLYK